MVYKCSVNMCGVVYEMLYTCSQTYTCSCDLSVVCCIHAVWCILMYTYSVVWCIYNKYGVVYKCIMMYGVVRCIKVVYVEI